jgi:hypothetical protein
MAVTELASKSYAELLALRDEIDQLLDQKLEETKDQFRREMAEKAKSLGLDPSEFLGPSKAKVQRAAKRSRSRPERVKPSSPPPIYAQGSQKSLTAGSEAFPHVGGAKTTFES